MIAYQEAMDTLRAQLDEEREKNEAAKAAHDEAMQAHSNTDTAKAYLEACRPGIAVSLSALLDPKAPPKAPPAEATTAGASTAS